LADETIIMTPATAQPLSFESEGNGGNTDQNFRELFTVESFRRRGRLKNFVRTARKLRMIADASRGDRTRHRIDARIEDRESRRERIG